MQPIELTEISQAQLDFLNTIYSRNDRVLFQLDNEPCALVFTEANIKSRAPEKSQMMYRPEICLKVRSDHHMVWLFFDHNFCVDKIKPYADPEQFAKLPLEIKSAIYEVVFEDVLVAFDRSLKTNSVIEEVSFQPDKIDYGYVLFFKLVLNKSNYTVRGHFSFDWYESAKWMSDILAKIPPSPLLQLDDLPVFTQLEIGRTSLPLKEYQGLAHDDIILMDQTLWRQKQDLVIMKIMPNITLKGKLDEDRIIIKEISEDEKMDNDTLDQDTLELKDDQLDQLAINLVFEIGQKTISLGDLKNLKPGFTFEFQKKLEKPIAIRANGNIIAYGGLVKIDDHLGVRIQEFVKNAIA